MVRDSLSHLLIPKKCTSQTWQQKQLIQCCGKLQGGINPSRKGRPVATSEGDKPDISICGKRVLCYTYLQTHPRYTKSTETDCNAQQQENRSQARKSSGLVYKIKKWNLPHNTNTDKNIQIQYKKKHWSQARKSRGSHTNIRNEIFPSSTQHIIQLKTYKLNTKKKIASIMLHWYKACIRYQNTPSLEEQVISLQKPDLSYTWIEINCDLNRI